MLAVAGAFLSGCLAARAHAQDGARFAVVNLTTERPGAAAVIAETERELARLRPGSRPIEDADLRRLLATGEGPGARSARLVRQAEGRLADDACDAAVADATEAEALTLEHVTLDDERDLLRRAYTVLVTCHDRAGRADERSRAALKLRALSALPPEGFPQELWDRAVAPAVAPEGGVEIYVDTDPPNAQVQVNLRGEGVTPRTIKVPPGEVLVEVQKDGYVKGFRRLAAEAVPLRAVFRLIDKGRDRMAQAQTTFTFLRGLDPAGALRTLARLAQLARAEALVLVTLGEERVQLRFFDAERGRLADEVIDSPYDPATGRIALLAARPTPAAAVPKLSSQGAAAVDGGGRSAPPEPPASVGAALPEADWRAKKPVTLKRSPAPWWSWAIAGALGVAFGAYVFLDAPEQADTLAVRAYWRPPVR